MSETGGDTGSGSFGGGTTSPADSGGGGKGATSGMGEGGTGAAGKGANPVDHMAPGSDTASYDYTPGATTGGTTGTGTTGGGTGGGSSGTGGGVADTSGSMFGSQYPAASVDNMVSNAADTGFNLAGSGPVGGFASTAGVADTGPLAAHGGVFTTDASGTTPLAQDTNALGTTTPAAGGATSAAGFAAPSGVSGIPQLDNIVSSPMSSATPMAPDNSSIWDSLNGAQTAVANDYANTVAPGIPAAPGESMAAMFDSGGGTSGASSTPSGTSGTSSGSSSTPSGGGNSQTTGILSGMGGSNNLGAAVAGAGLLNNLINGKSNTASTDALKSNAATSTQQAQDLIAKGTALGTQYGDPALQSGQSQVATGSALQQYVATGTLPAGYEAQVQEAAQAAKATITSNYANRGLSTDPTRNSMLAQELAQVDARLPAAREQLAQQLATTGNSIVSSGNQTSQTGNALTSNGLISNGLQASGISSSVYQTLANLENSQNTQRGQAIANFASALNGGTKAKAA